MQYDPIKRSLGNVFNKTPFLRKLFYKLLDMLLLRSWHIRREIREWAINRPEAQILDAGSGFGQYTYFLSGKSKRYVITAVDVKEEQVEDCNNFFKQIKRKNARFEVADLTTYVKPEMYNLILSVDVMEHIEEDVLVFENFAKSLVKGGMLLISTPSDQGGSDVHGDDDTSFIEEHVRDGYNMEEIKKKILSAGFSEVKVRYSYGWAGKISWKFSMKYPILMLGKTKAFFIILPFYYLIFYPWCIVLNFIDVWSSNKTGTGLVVKAWK
jgi:SAM-dependent methyltransferase